MGEPPIFFAEEVPNASCRLAHKTFQVNLKFLLITCQKKARQQRKRSGYWHSYRTVIPILGVFLFRINLLWHQWFVLCLQHCWLSGWLLLIWMWKKSVVVYSLGDSGSLTPQPKSHCDVHVLLHVRGVQATPCDIIERRCRGRLLAANKHTY